MKNSQCRSIMMVLAVVLVLALTAAAQGTGTVTLTGKVGESASIRFDNLDTKLTPGITGSNATADDTALAYTVNFGDIADATSGAAIAKVAMFLRSNADFTISAGVTGLAAAPATTGDISLLDFGYGVPDGGIKDTGARSQKNITTNNYDVAPSGEVTGGVPSFSKTLVDLNTQSTVLKGSRISLGGSTSDTTNALKITPEYVIQPQYFTPLGSFNVTVTYTITTP